MSFPSKTPPAAMTGIGRSGDVPYLAATSIDLGYDSLQPVLREPGELLVREAKVTTGQRTLDHQRVGDAAVASPPGRADDVGRPGGGDDGNQLHCPVADQRGEFQGKAGAGDDGGHALVDRRVDQGVVSW